MMFMKAAPNSFGFINPRDIEDLWRDQFDWVYRENDYAVFALTIHPDVSGRPQVLLMLERIHEYISSHAGVRFCTFDEIADDFRRRCPAGFLDRPRRTRRAVCGRVSIVPCRARRIRGATSPMGRLAHSAPGIPARARTEIVCSLCGVLGGRRHWTESAASPEAFAGRTDDPYTGPRAPAAHPDPERRPRPLRTVRVRLDGREVGAQKRDRAHRAGRQRRRAVAGRGTVDRARARSTRSRACRHPRAARCTARAELNPLLAERGAKW